MEWDDETFWECENENCSNVLATSNHDEDDTLCYECEEMN